MWALGCTEARVNTSAPPLATAGDPGEYTALDDGA